ncbi:glycosyltransferase [Dactylosporangium siamense]|uniref:N-acetylglucosaminyl-phosphatidylinositol biosynthetic protein n=1 Tax=Dactylosporangium siamense TaxID=685454 RepID=A0A919PFF9_9ACTN|nr:glycosyltransferase [Dactylosporangium siamense]GIG43846.1 N-acetylglucosaminyl-phosphatidylinositol biosynthetic protein [Dactylosporangium siamense]
MRIAHVTDVYLPRLGGIELQVRDLATRQRAAGLDPLVLTTTAGPHQPGDGGGPPVLRLGGGVDLGPYHVLRDRALRSVLAAQRVEAVHVHLSAFSPLGWTAARVAADGGLPTVVSVHSMWHDIVPLVRRYARWHAAADWPVVWAAVSTAAATAVRDALDGAPVAVLPNGIDPADWLTPAPRGTAAVPTFISVMRMVRRKRPRQLLRMLLDLHVAHPGRFRAVLVGDGPLLPVLRRDLGAAEAGTGIQLTGALDRATIRTLLATSDVYLAPAPRESFGIAALEARSAGLPVIARAGSGVADFILHGVEGWLVHSDADLRAAAAAVLDAPARLAAVARHNRAVPPRVRWQTVLESADALYAAAARRQGILVPLPMVAGC